MLYPTTGTDASKSDMLRRALGLDRAQGMMSTVFNARTRALSITGGALGFKSDSSHRPPGLGNHDNSCFQNSILQGLGSLKAFPDYLSACVQHANLDDESDRAVTHTLRALISDLNDFSNNGRTLWTPSTLKFMSTWTQQDAQEYYSKILDDIDKGAARTLKALTKHRGLESDNAKDDASTSQASDDSGYQSISSSLNSVDPGSFRNPLEGLLAQRVSCVQCGYSEGLSMIPFNCLTLSLSLDRRYHDLYERLDAYSEIESISGVECPKCTLLKAQRLLSKLIERMQDGTGSKAQLEEPLRRLRAVEEALEEDLFDDKTIKDNCKISPSGRVTTTKTKQVVIARPPQSLAIHVNRSVFDPHTFHTVKNSAPVEFPSTLDLGPWCLGSAETADRAETPSLNPDSLNILEERWQGDPTASMAAGGLRPSRLAGPIYELMAVVTHAGRHENGHYICYKKVLRSGYSESTTSNTGSSLDGNDDNGGDEGVSTEPSTLRDDSEPTSETKASHPEWWRLSDHNVSQVDEETISSLTPGVFMLFYERIDPSMVLQETPDNYASASDGDSDKTLDELEPPPTYSESVKVEDDRESRSSSATETR